MKRLSSTLPNMVISLVCVTLFSGLVLGILYEVTKRPIAEQVKEQQLEAIRRVAPAFDNNPETDQKTIKIDGNDFVVYPAIKNGELQGASVRAVTMSGFSGEIVVMVGFDKNGEVKDYQVLQHAETPGLGSKMQEWFRNPAGARSIIGKNPSETRMYVSKDGSGDVDAITAATISSRAFLEAVRNAYSAYCDYAAEKGEDVSGLSECDAAT